MLKKRGQKYEKAGAIPKKVTSFSQKKRCSGYYSRDVAISTLNFAHKLLPQLTVDNDGQKSMVFLTEE